MSVNSLNIGMVQENPTVGDIKGNITLAIKSIKHLKENSAHVRKMSLKIIKK